MAAADGAKIAQATATAAIDRTARRLRRRFPGGISVNVSTGLLNR